jgi:hypothetical protein
MSLKSHFTYDALNDCVVAEFDEVILKDEADVGRWSTDVRAKLATFGRKVYLLIDLTGLIVKPGAAAPFGRERALILAQFTVHSYRYGGATSTKTAIFTSAVLHGADANVYLSRQKATEAMKKDREASKG